jgi:hypothetical protein
MSNRRKEVRHKIKKLLEYVTGGENMSVDSINSSNLNTTPAAKSLAAYGYSTGAPSSDIKGKYYKEVPTKGYRNKKNKRKRKIIS